MRLEFPVPVPVPVPSFEFQFHKGAIGVSRSVAQRQETTNFNSIKVRLELFLAIGQIKLL